MTTMTTETAKSEDRKSVLGAMANRYGMEPKAFEVTVKATLGLEKCNDGQFAAFLCVANEYGLNPLTKEIYAFPTKTGGIQPIVGIDGWINLANSHPMFDGMEFEDSHDSQGCLAAITCRIHRKDRRHSICVTEYMNECRGNSGPWKQFPTRMLRHKATIQAIRYAFGFAGVMDPDEYDRMITVDAQVSKAVKNEPIRITQIPVVSSVTTEQNDYLVVDDGGDVVPAISNEDKE
jgi:phage recombination protein Bet